MQEDGNFVVYDEAMKPCFSTGTDGHPGAVPPAAERRQPGGLLARPDGPLGLADSCEVARMAGPAPRIESGGQAASSALPPVGSVVEQKVSGTQNSKNVKRPKCNPKMHLRVPDTFSGPGP